MADNFAVNLFRVIHPRRERRYRPRGLNIDGLYDSELRARYRFGRNSMGNLHYRLNFDPGKTNKTFYHCLKEHVKISKIAKFGCEML